MKEPALPAFVLPERVRGRRFDILAIGSLVLEMIVEVERWPEPGGQDVTRVSGITYTAGGCALNVACFAARLGAVTSVLSMIGGGEFTDRVWEEIRHSNVEPAFLLRGEGKQGNLIVILTNPDGDWSVLDYLNADLVLHREHIPTISALQEVKIAHIDGFSFVNVGDKDAIELAVDRASEAGCIISVDGSVPAAKCEPEFLAHLFGKADIVFATKYEALAATKTTSVDAAVRGIRALGPQWAVMKMGAEGSLLVTPDRTFEVPAHRVDVVDTVAAGDAYIATMLYCVLREYPLLEAATRGSAAGALACLGRGSLSSQFTMGDIESLVRRGPEQGKASVDGGDLGRMDGYENRR